MCIISRIIMIHRMMHILLGCGPGESEEDEDGAIEPDEVFIRKASDRLFQLAPRHRRDLVDHQMTRGSKPIPRRRLNREAHQWRIDRMSCKGTERNGSSGVEGIVLENDGRPGLTRVIGSTGNRPHVTAFHSGGQSETASTKS